MSEENNKQIQPVGSFKPALISGGAIGAIVPQDFEAVWRLAQVIGISRMCPKEFDSPEKVAVAIMHGLEVGLSPMTAMQSIAVVNGRPSLWGDAVIGLVRGSGLLEYFKEELHGEGDSMRAVCTVKRKGDAEHIVSEFSVQDATKANLWGKSGPWSQYPKRMLKLRARGFALRDGFSDVLRGLHVAEEQRDIEISEQITEEAPPAPVAKQEPAIEHKPAPKTRAKKKEQPKPEPEQEEAAVEDPQSVGGYDTPTDFLSALDEGLAVTNDEDTLEEVWSEFDAMANLESFEEFQDTANTIKERHLKRIAEANEEPPSAQPMFRDE